MKKKLSKIILAPFILYFYNLVAFPLNLNIPINLITILIVAFLDIPGLITLVLFLLLMF